jgi:dTDP-glucose 4,6-dehydratase
MVMTILAMVLLNADSASHPRPVSNTARISRAYYRSMTGRILVTGGLGFIGSEFIRQSSSNGVEVLNVDAFTYAADPHRLLELDGGAPETVRGDVSEPQLSQVVSAERPSVIVHFAAETHVTRSEVAAARFWATNVDGTRRVLEAAEKTDVGLVVHVSTDEVYGPCASAPFKESEKAPGEGRATSVYARSKALADDLACGFADRIPMIVVRPTNCFGPWQHPEKAVSRWISRVLRGHRLPVWGDGAQVRDWMHVSDAVSAMRLVIDDGVPGETYNIGPAGDQITNLTMARKIAAAAGSNPDDVYLSAYDRPRHDQRYAVDATKLRGLGWSPRYDIDSAIADTVEWYRANETWWRRRLDEAEALYRDDEERDEE